jgi:hypothetical protein
MAHDSKCDDQCTRPRRQPRVVIKVKGKAISEEALNAWVRDYVRVIVALDTREQRKRGES